MQGHLQQTFFSSSSSCTLGGKCSINRSFTDVCRQHPGVKTAASSPSVTTSSSNDNEQTDVQLAGNIAGVLQQSQKNQASDTQQQPNNDILHFHTTAIK